ncbi:ferritin-like domain-containing protein [Hymenobacter sp. HMF4947]|uniref:Ferritin-like domain-containing protein n=1 Tax=Hymenobacter ginkgonis TaxID=2682976 RepID=A0A7K1TKY2_9BACT|nr:ferritin-like domain-containing protein [Hymenobacter ginkgonis]MVN78761.1 ferritin-like domain-containing protein [Hymenobacter ginkgonis]
MTFSDIKTYFQANRRRFADLAWDDPHQLGPATLRAVQGSLQTFQRGEGTGGDHLAALAEQLGDADYAAAMQLFIQEEKGHADMLGQFMDKQGIPRLQKHWLHTVFRGLGRPLGLVHMVRVILTAEVVATVYYRALFNATYSGLLQQICRRILLDEEMHLVFHCLAIRQLSSPRNWLSQWFWKQVYRGLMAGTALVVYATTRSALRAGGYGFWGFCAAIATEYARVEQMQRPDGLLVMRGSQAPTPAVAAGPAGAWQWPSQSLRAAR